MTDTRDNLPVFSDMMEPPVCGSEAPPAPPPPWSAGLKTSQQVTASPYDYVKAGVAVSSQLENGWS